MLLLLPLAPQARRLIRPLRLAPFPPLRRGDSVELVCLSKWVPAAAAVLQLLLVQLFPLPACWLFLLLSLVARLTLAPAAADADGVDATDWLVVAACLPSRVRAVLLFAVR
jgi:hypothetical protein